MILQLRLPEKLQLLLQPYISDPLVIRWLVDYQPLLINVYGVVHVLFIDQMKIFTYL